MTLDGGGFAFGAKPGFVQHHPSDTHVVVPDAHLLFSGTYMRIGNDLIISGGDQKFVVGSYFKGENRPPLTSKDGATLSGHIIDALTGHVHYAQAGAAGTPAQVIGHVMKLTGSATVIRNGVAVELNIGDAVQKSDVVQTGSDSSMGLTFIDGSAFGMTSNARMVLNEMIYDPNGSSNSSLISLVQGTITFVAGQTAKNGNMRVETPVATMGIRGTAVLVEISANDGPTKFSVLVEPDGKTGSFNLYDKTTGQLIGTVSQAGQVTFVSSLGVGQPPTAIEQLKTLAEQQNEKFIVQQVFQLYFPNFTPDDAKPKSPNSNPRTDIGVPENIIGKYAFDPATGRPTYTVITPITNPDTHQTTNTQVTFYNIKAAFSTTGLSAKEESPGDTASGLVKLTDAVHINDPDIGIGPFFDVATKFVAHSGTITSSTTTADLTPGAKAALDLGSLLTINQTTGDVSFNRADFNFLAAGEKAEFIIRVTASSGPDSEQVFVKITINGENDAPTIVTGATDDHGSVKEEVIATGTASDLATSGTITFQDFDLTDGHQATFTLKSAVSSAHLPGFVDGAVGTVGGVTGIGAFSLDSVNETLNNQFNTGQINWNYVLDNDSTILQSLAAGQTITLIYTVTITDGHGGSVPQDVEITITGTNDKPTIESSTNDHPALTEDGILSASGVITFRDVDLTDGHLVTSALTAGSISSTLPGFNPALDQLGTLTLTKSESTTDTINTGTVSWSFAANNALLQQLAVGQVVTQTYTVTIDDQHGGTATQTIVITITGRNDDDNDDPVIVSSTNDHPSLTEDATISANGVITFKDVDLTDGHVVTQALTAGTISSASPGFNPATNQLGTLTLVKSESTTDTINTGTVSWSFAANNALLQQLAAGQVVTQTYTVTIDDQHGGTPATQSIVITITGTNDVPVITSETLTGAVTELVTPSGNLTNTGIITFTDVDLTDVHVVSPTGTPVGTTLGSLAVVKDSDTTGTGLGGKYTWTYTVAASAVEYLAATETRIEKFSITLDDQHGGVITKEIEITIHGTNDAPMIYADTSGTAGTNVHDLAETNSGLTASGTLAVSDVDVTNTVAVSVHDLAVSGTGARPSGLTDAVLKAMFSVNTGNVIDNTHTTGIINWGFNSAGQAFDFLAAGENLVLTYTIRATDSDATHATGDQTVVIEITGTNDAPTLASVSKSLVDTAATDTFANQTGTLVGTDVDNGETAGLTYATLSGSLYVNTAVTGAYGALTVLSNGSYTYVPNAAAINALNAGSYVDTFTVQTKDAHGATGTATFTVNVTGANDAPTVAAALTLSTTEGNGPTVENLLAGASDVDTGDTLSVTNLKIDGVTVAVGAQHGGIRVFPDAGTFKINVDGANPAFDHIAAGATQSILVSYDVTDSHGLTVAQTETITVNGANDRPLLAAGQNLTTITEDQTTNSDQLVSSFATGITDADDGAVKGIAITGFTSQNGHWEYALKSGPSNWGTWTTFGAYSSSSGLLLALDDKVRFVPDGVHGGSNTLTYVAWDQTTAETHGQTTSISGGLHSDPFSFGPGQTATLTVTDVNDAPVINADNVSTLELGNGVTKVTGVTFTDVDAGTGTFTVTASADHGTVAYDDGNQTVSLGAGVSGSFAAIASIFNDGAIYTPTNASPTDKVTLTITDGQASDTLNFIFKQFATGGVTLNGTAGKDWILSSTGADTMTGGAGADNFVFAPSSGQDTITDFAQGVDKIDLHLLSGPNASTIISWLQTAAEVVGTDTLLHLNGNTDTVLVKGITALNANDFILHA